MSHYSVGPYTLQSTPLPKASEAKPTPQPTNHIVVIDCSGSMYYDLPKIREQLKGKLPHLLAEGDTISIVWFSGRNEYGTLVKGEPVATLKDLSDLNKAIDRWLKPVCLTGFKQPLEEVSRLVDQLGGACSLFFMSDGYDNQWGSSEILNVVQELGPKLASSTFVEYGYYCNHALMVSMAETAGGALILNEDFSKYEPNFEAAMQKRALGVKKVDIAVGGKVAGDIAFALHDGALLSFAKSMASGCVSVPEYLTEVWTLHHDEPPPAKNSEATEESTAATYAAIALFAQRMESDIVLELLKSTGDVRLIKQFSGCFGKQAYAAFVDEATKAALEPSKRLVEGYDPSAVPDENAFTVLDLLRILSEDDGNYLLLDSEDFKYNRTGRTREQVVELPEDVQKEVEALEEQLGEASAAEAKKLQKQIEALKAPYAPLKFVADPMPHGVPIQKLVFNEDRPNVSIQTRRAGRVNIKDRKAGAHKALPDEFQTFIFRNYTIIRDGIINVDRLPVRITKATATRLLDEGMPFDAVQNPTGETLEQTRNRLKKAAKDRETNMVLDLRSLPIVNRAMVKKASAADLFRTQFELTKARAAQKVYNTVKKDRFGGKTSEGFAALYGAAEAEWLKEQGLTDYSGFNPGGKQSTAQDSYVGKELKISLKGLSTIPSLNDFNKRIASGKALTPSQSLLKPASDAVEAFLESDVYKDSKDQDKVFEAWLDSELEAQRKVVRDLLYKTAQTCFSVVVGQTWFTEFASLDENSLDIDVEGTPLKCTVEMREITVSI